MNDIFKKILTVLLAIIIIFILYLIISTVIFIYVLEKGIVKGFTCSLTFGLGCRGCGSNCRTSKDCEGSSDDCTICTNKLCSKN